MFTVIGTNEVFNDRESALKRAIELISQKNHDFEIDFIFVEKTINTQFRNSDRSYNGDFVIIRDKLVENITVQMLNNAVNILKSKDDSLFNAKKLVKEVIVNP